MYLSLNEQIQKSSIEFQFNLVGSRIGVTWYITKEFKQITIEIIGFNLILNINNISEKGEDLLDEIEN